MSRKQELFLSAHRFSLWPVDPAQRFVVDACANSKDYLHCVLSLEKATIICRSRDSSRLERKRTRTPIVNSRNALRNAPALAGCALARAFSLYGADLPRGKAHDHRESEDRSDPGGCRV